MTGSVGSRTPKLHSRPFTARLRASLPYWILMLVPLFLLLLFKYYPMYGVTIAFRDYRVKLGINGSPWVGLKHFKAFFSSPSALNVIWNTFVISIYTLVLGFPAPILLAICLNSHPSKRFGKSVQMITYMPYFISTVVLVSLIIQFTDLSGGLVNQILHAFGASPINFMGDKTKFRAIYVLTGIWQNTGYSAVIYLAALAGVSPELYDAAKVDGASKLRIVRHVDLPSILPTIKIIFILNTGSVLSVAFEKIYLMQNNINISISEVISTYIYKMGLQSGNYSFSTAAGLCNSLVSFALVFACNELSRRTSDGGLW